MTLSKLLPLTLMLVCSLGACSASQEAPSATAPPAAASPGKPAAAVDVRFRASGKPQPGVPYDVDVSIRATAPFDTLQVEISAEPELPLFGGPRLLNVPAANAGAVLTERVRLLPGSANSLLRVTAITTIDGLQQRKVVVYPVQVTSAAQQAPIAPAEVTPQGEKIIRLPAEESAAPQ